MSDNNNLEQNEELELIEETADKPKKTVSFDVAKFLAKAKIYFSTLLANIIKYKYYCLAGLILVIAVIVLVVAFSGKGHHKVNDPMAGLEQSYKVNKYKDVNEILVKEGFTFTGSDSKETEITDKTSVNIYDFLQTHKRSQALYNRMIYVSLLVLYGLYIILNPSLNPLLRVKMVKQ